MSAHQHAASDPDISAFVTANAGSGKTKTLIDRTARLLLRGVRPEAILCVTFTKAAAAEMQRRLFHQLGGWSVAADEALAKDLSDLQGVTVRSDDQAALGEARKLFAKALETPGGLKIQTIHAFCERLLRRFPLEAGVSPTFTVIDDAAAAAIAKAAKANVATAVLDDENAFVTEAYSRFSVALDFDSFERMFGEFEAQREAIVAYLDSQGGIVPARDHIWRVCGFTGIQDREALRDAAFDALNLPAWVDAANLFDAAQTNGKLADALREAVRSRDFEDALAAMFTAGGAGDPVKAIDTAAAFKPRPDLREALLRDQDALERAREQDRACDTAEQTVLALALAHVYAGQYEQEKAWRGVLDFADLVKKACELLRDSPHAAWVLYKLDGGIDHILLDEAQDTAPDQWTILRALTDEFFTGAGLPAERPVERTLFVVGDEKQSIYSFQGADPVRLQQETREHLEKINASGRIGRELPLEVSYRSVEQVLTFVDAVFEPEGHRTAVQAGSLKTVRHILHRKDKPGCVDFWPPEQERKGEERTAWADPLDTAVEDNAYRRLADKIAREIKALVARGDAIFDKAHGGWRAAGYGDVLILVRRRSVLFEEILRALKRIGVPVAGADRLALSAHIVFDDLLALARFALYPQDELTLAALLKSPLCGLDDDSLYALAHGRIEKLWLVLGKRAPERAEWARALAFLSGVVATAKAARPFEFYQKLLCRLDGEGRSGRKRLLARLGREADDAIDEFLGQVLAAEARGVRDLESLAAELDGIDITVKREMDEARAEVRVMTAHGAKGLEAPIVILPEMTPSPPARKSPLLKTAEGGFLWAQRKAEDCDAARAARDLRDAKDAEERLRLLYVALTRARDRLILCGRISSVAKVETIEGWYRAARTALDTLGTQVREIDTGAGPFLRYGEDPAPGPDMKAGVPSALVTPAWLSEAPGPEAEGLRYLSPSALAESQAHDPAVSPLESAQGLGRFRRGTLIHRLLQLLPDVEPAARAAGAAALLAREPGLDNDQRAEMAAAALGVLDDDQFAAVFGPGSRAEVAVAGQAATLPSGIAIGGRMDRLVVEEGRVLVIDFKTNRPAPARIEDADRAYLMQMAAYVAVLKEAFPGRRVEAALVWTDGPKLMAVPEILLTRALAELTASA